LIGDFTLRAFFVFDCFVLRGFDFAFGAGSAAISSGTAKWASSVLNKLLDSSEVVFAFHHCRGSPRPYRVESRKSSKSKSVSKAIMYKNGSMERSARTA